MSVADYPDFQTPQAHATQIAATGVPLLHNANVLSSSLTQNVNPSTTFDTGDLAMTQPSYELAIFSKTIGTPASPWLEAALVWSDVSNPLNIDVDRFWIPASPTSPGLQVFARGPSKGTVVRLQLTNTDAAQAMSVNYRLLQSSRVFERDIMHWDNQAYPTGMINGYQLPSLPPDFACLGFWNNKTIPASSTLTSLFAPWDGLIQVVCQVNTGSAASLTTSIRPQPDSQFATFPITFTAAGVAPNGQFAGSRAPLRVDLVNAATSAMQLTFALWAIRPLPALMCGRTRPTTGGRRNVPCCGARANR